ncbi:MAG: 16S rRNA (uracil(1498)-N(3))-methyltransferase [Micavibrio sp.]|nr:16S rRNA (uracil(1498)-N(3))-methyltransferase [Micavibrio sp.]
MTTVHSKLPRLYIDHPLTTNTIITLGTDQAHYLRNVMRMDAGKQIRLFNGKDGEYLCTLTESTKKSVIAVTNEQLRTQPSKPCPIHLIFAPIKKQRLDILIEKAVELGATHLHPVITDHTENRKLKEEKVNAQILEAVEQCERFDIPELFPLTPLKGLVSQWKHTDKIHWAAERHEDVTPLTTIQAPAAILIGPEGGFSEHEADYLSNTPIISPISLGERILRAETAAFYTLSHIKP